LTETEAIAAPRRGRTALAVTVVLGVLAGLFVLVLATREPSTDRQTSSPLVGKPAPAIIGETLAGRTFDLDRSRGRWVVVNFFATWCVPCRTEHPELVRFSEQHARTGDADVVSVIFDDETDAAREFFSENGGDWAVLLDEDRSLSVRYAVFQVPESYIVAPDGTVVAKLVGGVTAAGLDKLLAELGGRAA
jgi:cytochrome c biogenesis protein CcmG/thiol:disulfide interchange protein DsbE